MTRSPVRGTKRLLLADRSVAFRRTALRVLGGSGGWYCETASTIREARDKIVSRQPAVLVLEGEMPGNENGEFMQRLQQYHPMPVIALVRGRATGPAVPYMAVIPRDDDDERVATELARALEFCPAATEKVRQASYRIIAIGSSTGGTEAVEQVLRMLPEDGPGVVIAQHIPPRFSTTFAERLNRVTQLVVKEAEDGDVIRDGEALVAPGDHHMRVVSTGSCWEVRLDQGPKVWHQRPAADILFASVAEKAATRAVGVVLTGMGQDGAAGLRQMRDAGCWTIVQDEASCVVFGMPRAAIEAGAACEVVPLQRVAAAIGAQARSAGSNLSRK